MIDELIDKEKRKLLEKLNEFEQTKKDLEQIDKQIETLKLEISNLSSQLAMPIVVQQFNVFQRIFSKKYKEYIKQKNAAEIEREQYEKSKTKKEELLYKLKNKKEQKDKIISSINKNQIKSDIDAFRTREKAIEKILELHPELSKNKEVMKELLEIDPRYLRLDRTDDTDLYMGILRKMKNDIKANASNNYKKIYIPKLEKLEKIIRQKNNIVEKGRYAIPLKYLYENLRKEILNQYEYDMEYGAHYPWYTYALKSIDIFDELNGRFQNEFGKELEAMYEDEQYLVTIHGIERNSRGYFNEKTKNSIMLQGVKATNSMGELSGYAFPPTLSATTKRKGLRKFFFF